ncbi:MAG TPA: hypothetical protein VK808_10945, partial [Bacteroidia bacterium]|nr:hypothetical protein [Bacteroidia bacterium]
ISKNIGLIVRIDSLLNNFSNIPSLPGFRSEFLKQKTAIELMSFLTYERSEFTPEIVGQILAGDSLPMGKKYLEDEGKNLIAIKKELFKEFTIEKKPGNLSQELIKRIHRLAPDNSEKGKEIQLTNEQEEWISKFLEWLEKEVVFEGGSGSEVFIKAIIIHAYFEWSQPFLKASRLTGYLLEYVLLLSGGIPNMATHILPVFYHETRTEYLNKLESVKTNGDMAGFITYALQGVYDGLEDIVRSFQVQQLIITWEHYIDTTLNNDNSAGNKVTIRQKELMHAFPLYIGDGLSFEEVLVLNSTLARAYAKRAKTARRDLAALTELGLLVKNGKKYYPNVAAILGEAALRSSLVKLEQLSTRKEIKHSHHVMPKVGVREMKSELLHTLNELSGRG